MSGWKIGNETYTLSEISSEIRKRNSDIATNLVEMIRIDRDSNSQNSVGLRNQVKSYFKVIQVILALLPKCVRKVLMMRFWQSLSK